MKERSIEVKVGLLILVALGLLGAFVLVRGKQAHAHRMHELERRYQRRAERVPQSKDGHVPAKTNGIRS